FGLVLTRCSSNTPPASSSTQYQLERSPRSSPTVNFCDEILLLAFAAAVLTFFIAGLLYLWCLKHVDNLGAYSIPSETGLLIPSVNNSYSYRGNNPFWTYTLPMRSAAFAIFLISATAMYPQSNQSNAMMARWKKAQMYASEGF